MPDAAFMARARAAAELMMEDTCTIRRDPNFASDSTLDAATGALSPSPTPPAVAGTTTVYSGKCTVTAVERQDEDANEGGAVIVRRTYQATIPLDAAAVAIGDALTVDSSTRDEQLVDQSFVVTGVTFGTNVYQRRLDLNLNVRADAQ